MSPRQQGIHLDIYPPLSLVRKRLQLAMVYVQNWKPAWWGIARAFYAMEKRAFATEGRSQGQGWTALDPRYKAWKDQHYPGKPILQLTGDLKKSMTQRNAKGAFYESSFKEFAVGTVLPAGNSDHSLGVIHQAGEQLPARPPLVIDDKFRVAVSEICTAHMMHVLKTIDMPLGMALGGRIG